MFFVEFSSWRWPSEFPTVRVAVYGLSLAVSKRAPCAFVFEVEPIVSGFNVFINYCACKIVHWPW